MWCILFCLHQFSFKLFYVRAQSHTITTTVCTVPISVYLNIFFVRSISYIFVINYLFAYDEVLEIVL